MAGFETLPGGVKRRRLLPAAGGKYVGLVFLFDLETTKPLAIIHDSVMQKLRVGATSAIGARVLARQDASVLGLFGSGWQAGAHLEALRLVRPLREVRVYSPTRARREKFAEEMSARFNLAVRAVDDPADVVRAATASKEPVFDGRLLEPGQHVGCIVASDKTQPRLELDDAAVTRCDVIVVGSREHAILDEQPDSYGLVQQGLLTWDRIHDLADLLNGKAPGRTDPRQITLLNNNVGMGIQFAALGSRALALARQKGMGQELPTEWLLEDTSP